MTTPLAPHLPARALCLALLCLPALAQGLRFEVGFDPDVHPGEGQSS